MALESFGVSVEDQERVCQQMTKPIPELEDTAQPGARGQISQAPEGPLSDDSLEGLLNKLVADPDKLEQRGQLLRHRPHALLTRVNSQRMQLQACLADRVAACILASRGGGGVKRWRWKRSVGWPVE